MPHPNITGRSSGVLNADTLIKTGPGKVHCITIQVGTVQYDVRLYDGLDVSGVLIFQAKRAGGVAVGDFTDHFVFPARISFSTGLFLRFANASGAVVSPVIYE